MRDDEICNGLLDSEEGLELRDIALRLNPIIIGLITSEAASNDAGIHGTPRTAWKCKGIKLYASTMFDAMYNISGFALWACKEWRERRDPACGEIMTPISPRAVQEMAWPCWHTATIGKVGPKFFQRLETLDYT